MPSAARCRAVSISSSRAAGSSPATPTWRPCATSGRFRPEDYAPREVWVIGGAEIYAQTLPRCAELYLSLLDQDVDGDTFFPAFEPDFRFAETVLQKPGFEVRRYVNTKLPV